jgi:acyl-CoA dehydrogenase-like protein
VIDFSTTGEQRELAVASAALLRGCTDCGGADASDATWRALADFGAWGLLTSSGGGALGELVALLGALGAGLCPGPIVATAAIGAVVDGAEAELLGAGRLRATVAVDGYVPWLHSADLVLEIDGDEVWRVDAQPEDRPVRTLSGEPWPAARITRLARLDNGAAFVVAAELGLGASLVGMAGTLLDRGAAHARTREQFGRPIGSFQGVAHPLADAWAGVTAAAELVRLVAAEHANREPGAPTATYRARLARAHASAAALQTAYVVHQVMGGLSFAVETGIASLSTRLRQWSLLFPDLRSIGVDGA